jgi:CBS domain containing-hemolysin-like protein
MCIRDRPSPPRTLQADKIMTPRERMIVSTDPNTTNLEKIINELKLYNAQHLPILDANDVFQRLVYVEDIMRFIDTYKQSNPSQPTNQLTLQ